MVSPFPIPAPQSSAHGPPQPKGKRERDCMEEEVVEDRVREGPWGPSFLSRHHTRGAVRANRKQDRLIDSAARLQREASSFFLKKLLGASSTKSSACRHKCNESNWIEHPSDFQNCTNLAIDGGSEFRGCHANVQKWPPATSVLGNAE